MKWVKYKRGLIYFNRIYYMIKANQELSQKLFDVPFGGHLYYTNRNACEWYLEKKWLFGLGNRIIANLISNNKDGKKYRNNFKKYYQLADEFNQKIRNLDLHTKSSQQLVKLINSWFEIAYLFNGFTNSPIDALDECLFVQIRKELKKNIKNPNEYDRLFTIFNTPSTSTFIQKREFEILKLSKIIKEKNLKISDKYVQDNISKIAKRYWWTTLGWICDEELTENRIKQEIKNYLRENNIAKKYSESKNYSTKIEKTKIDEVKRLKPQQRFIDLLRTFEEVVVLHDQRKETQIKLVNIQNILYKEILKRNSRLSFYQINWLTVPEIIDYFQNNRDYRQLIKQREQHTLCYGAPKRYFLLKGEKAWKKRCQLVGREFSQKNSKIRGLSASKGKVIAVVFVTNDPNEAISGIKMGQILVTSQTTPDFVPAMKKAAAIVTDEGGATCHAAIISRELGIPCIVGTHIATEVLNTGDKIEVDADNGIVRKL